MNIFRCRISSLISFLLIIYFIPMVVGCSEAQSDQQVICVARIYEIFELSGQEMADKKLHFEYAVLYLRTLTEEEQDDHIIENELEECALHPLLFNGKQNGAISTTDPPYDYFLSIQNGFDISKFVPPDIFCSKPEYRVNKADCKYALQYFGFTGNNKQIIEFAFSHIVLAEISQRLILRKNMTMPDDVSYAEEYLESIAKIGNEDRLKLPAQFCT